MPCWFYEKPDLINTPSFKDGIDASTEARYRREGARFIIDAGTSQGLRYDTMATGVVYYHRFYMFHSFKEFPRFLTGAACLFLAGKVEETPKKCKDIIRMAKALVPDPHFSTFGDDPKEEIMTYERILLQTIKFELQVSHPYSYLLKYAKSIKGDKNKIQKLVQMAWTFVNDSLCTTLCLQWEPHIVATAFLYLAGRLSKSDLLDWSGKSSKIKWWDQLTDDVSLDIMEDICHQLLDLYSSGQQKGGPLPGTPPKGGKKKASKSTHPLLESAKALLDEPREKVAKVEKARDPALKAAPSPAPAAQGAPPVVTEYATQPAQAPPPPPKLVPSEQPSTHPAPPATSYPSQPPRPAPPTAPPPQQVAPAAPQPNQYYQGTYTAAAPAPAVAGATAPPTTYAAPAAPQQTYSQPTQPYQAPQTPVTPTPAPAAQSSYQTGQYGTAPAYGTQYYGQQSTYNQQYQQQPTQPTYPASAPSTAPATSQAPTQYGTQYTGQYGQSAPTAPPTQPHAFDPSVPPPRIQAPPSNVPPNIHGPPPSHPPPPTPPTHPQQGHPPSYPPAPHQPPPQTYAPQSNPPTPTVPPPQSQSYGYNAPPYQMQPQNVGVPRGPPPAPHHGQAPAPNISTGLATVRISSRESAWPGQHRAPSQNSQEWD